MSLSADSELNHLVIYCRSGFEKECAAEISGRAAMAGVAGYVKAKPADGYICYITHRSNGAAELLQQINFAELVFAREWFAARPPMGDLPTGDRVSALLGPVDVSSPLLLRAIFVLNKA